MERSMEGDYGGSAAASTLMLASGAALDAVEEAAITMVGRMVATALERRLPS